MSKVAVDMNDSGITRGSSNHVYMYVYLVAMISLAHACSRLRVLELLGPCSLESLSENRQYLEHGIRTQSKVEVKSIFSLAHNVKRWSIHIII